ncbi:glycosyl hydrolase family 61-domain-containing protein [Paraphysoderma sedebokerense]|nr:glycosyl hydrolase family 61-domain-containing protein [Paraphysoderma sedebokerense]
MRSLLTILCLAFLSSSVNGHIYLHSFMSSGQESTSCVRQLPPDSVKQSPIKNVEGPEMMCNVGKSPAKSTCEVKAGDSVTFQFYHLGPSPKDIIVHKSHRGPCSVYLSKADASDELIAAHGKLSIQIPSCLQDGRYVFRTEIIALHEAFKTIQERPDLGAQLYVNCGDINIKGGSGTLRPATVQIPSPQWATFNSPGIRFNLWNRENPNYGSYVVPGPPVLAESINGAGSTGKSPSDPGNGNGGQSGGNPGNSGSGSRNQGGQPEACQGTEVTETGRDGRKWGHENGRSCLVSGTTGGQGQGQRQGQSGTSDTKRASARPSSPRMSPAKSSSPSGGSSKTSGGNGEKFPACKKGKITAEGRDGRKWGFENNQSCLIG